MRYFVTIDENGKPVNGTTYEDGAFLPAEYTHEVTEEIWQNQDIYVFENDQWVEVPHETNSSE